jgi:hypothetical protein
MCLSKYSPDADAKDGGLILRTSIPENNNKLIIIEQSI